MSDTNNSGGVAKIAVIADENDMRVDRWFKEHYPDVTFGMLQKLLRKGHIRVDGKRAKSNTRVQTEQIIRVPPLNLETRIYDKKPPAELHQDDIYYMQNMVIHMDDELIVLNKPSGLAVQGGSNTKRHIDGMLDALKFELTEKPKLVHRLDKDTSGLLLIARTRVAAQKLTKAFQTKTTEKYYWAVVKSSPKHKEGKINMPLLKQGNKGHEKVVVAHDHDDAKSAITLYATVASVPALASFVVLRPITGRTHQLRVHMAEMGNVIIGDGKYGGTDAHIGGEVSRKLHLHARHIKIPHPSNGEPFEITAKISGHIKNTFHSLGFDEEAGDLVLERFEDR
ncbi:MAG: RluA family pseudouridine synthase [Hyphomicrobiales bacterium]